MESIGKEDIMRCITCNGKGHVECKRCVGTGVVGYSKETCPTCKGTGILKCPICEGTGEIKGH